MPDPVTVGLPVAKCLVDPCLAPCLDAIRRHCSYVTSYDDYVRQLEHKAILLEQRRKTIQDSMDDAENHSKPIKKDFKDWADNAKADAYEACRVLDDNVTATRFHGWLLNPKKRHGLGKDGKTIADRIKKLLELIPLGEVYDDPPSALVDGGLPVISSACDTVVQSRDSIFGNIMSALGDEKNKVIGIHGPGGVGKTTLVETVEKKLRIEKGPFHMIAKAKVSHAPDLKQIQVDIGQAFKLNLKDEPDEDRRRDLLLNKLKNLSKKDPSEKETSKRVLVILDDLWKELDLRAVGIPLGDESSGCQVLLTSRDEQVLRKMGAPLRFPLKGLSPDESFSLFEKTYGPDKLKNNEGLKAKAAEMVAKLAGLPLLINSVATTLKSDESDESDESKLETALTIIKDSDIKAIVEWSYGHLEREETKSLFLLCGFIGGGSIPVELLLGLGMVLGLFGRSDMTIQTSRNRMSDMLRRLCSICLLQDGSDDKKYVTIHDVYSEQVISTPLTGQNSLRTHHNAGSWPKEKLDKCWVCLVNVGSDRLAKLRLHWFPDSTIFILSKQHDERDCDGLDFTSMKELRVLYLRSIKLTGLRSLVEILKNLRSLYLDNCEVEDVAILGELKALQILSFAGSSISSLPKEIGKLEKLKLLNLSYCRKLRKIESGVFKGLSNLEELYMQRSFNGWMGSDEDDEDDEDEIPDEDEISNEDDEYEIPDEDEISDEDGEDEISEIFDEDEISLESCNAKLAELKSLEQLTTLEISIPDPIVLLEDGDLPFGDLIRFWINIGNAKEGEFEGLTSMMLNLEGCDGILSKDWVLKTLQKTQYLLLNGLRESKKSAYELCGRGFSPLKHLEIQNCSSIEHIVSSSNGAFPLLESLFLEDLTNLEKICDGPECFSKLKVMRVTKCNRLEYLWCLSQKHSFAQLEEIEVRSCASMRAIAIDDARDGIVVADNRVELPNLRRLKLAELPKMTSFCIGAGITSDGAPIQVNLPSLEFLYLVSVESLKSIWPREHPERSWDNLAEIHISECSELLNIFLSTHLGRLRNLRSVWIQSCPSLESVFDCGLLTECEIVSLPKLKRVYVISARALRHVVKSNPHTFLGFPSLDNVFVEDCFELRYLFPYGTATTLEKLKYLHISNCEQMKEVVAKEEGDRSEAGVLSFPFLTELKISQCPNFGAFIPNPTSAERLLGEMDKENDESREPFFNEMVAFPTLSYVRIGGIQVKELWNNQIHDGSFCELRCLKLMDCDNLQHIAPSDVWKRLQRCLKILEVKSCRSVEIIYESNAPVAETSHLSSLILDDLENLRHIWRYDSLPNINVPFPNLRDIEVQRCPSLRILFETFTASFLGQIHSLQVESCDDMELIADHGECEGAICTTITFSDLGVLILKQMPKFRRYLPEKYHVEFPSLGVLERVGCGKEPDQSDVSTRVNWGRYRFMARTSGGFW